MLPPITHHKWKDLVLGKEKHQFQLLAAKIMMARIITSVKNDSSSENVDKCIKNVHDFFSKNERISQSDLKQIFG